MTAPNTVFLRLDGPLQAWGVTSRFVVRDTADVSSKSGVLGLVCAALGLRRAAANARLGELAALTMGVRTDRPGTKFTDYHTAGEGVGMMSAKGIIKKTESTGEIETHVMRKEYPADAAFLVALQGDAGLVAEIAAALQDPVWPPFLGRKSCPPSVPVYAGTGTFDDLEPALCSFSFWPRREAIGVKPQRVRLVLETTPADGRPVADVPVSFTRRVYGTRWVREVELPQVDPGTDEERRTRKRGVVDIYTPHRGTVGRRPTTAGGRNPIRPPGKFPAGSSGSNATTSTASSARSRPGTFTTGPTSASDTKTSRTTCGRCASCATTR